MDQLMIKQATSSDSQLLQTLNHAIFSQNITYDANINSDWEFTPYGVEYFAKLCNDDSIYTIIAFLDDKPVGYLNGFTKTIPYRKTHQTVAEIENLGVIPDYRRLGIATSLYKEFRKWAFMGGATSLVVTSFSTNHDAIDFYQIHDFKQTDIILEKNLK